MWFFVVVLIIRPLQFGAPQAIKETSLYAYRNKKNKQVRRAADVVAPGAVAALGRPKYNNTYIHIHACMYTCIE